MCIKTFLAHWNLAPIVPYQILSAWSILYCIVTTSIIRNTTQGKHQQLSLTLEYFSGKNMLVETTKVPMFQTTYILTRQIVSCFTNTNGAVISEVTGLRNNHRPTINFERGIIWFRIRVCAPLCKLVWRIRNGTSVKNTGITIPQNHLKHHNARLPELNHCLLLPLMQCFILNIK